MSSPTLSHTRSGSHASSEGDNFQEASNSPLQTKSELGSPSPSPRPTQSPSLDSTPAPAKARTTQDDNQTLAALAASSSSSLPIRPPSNGSTDSLADQIDPNSASFLLLASLRSQITDLSSQVTSLNSKLVRSYTQIGDLEDDLHEVRSEDQRLKTKLTTLEADKARWEREIDGGGWVERNHVQGEMQRLMAKVLEETKNRETAVQAHSALETEIDSLTSTLFEEANKMVVFERVARAKAEEKTRSLEEAGQSMTGVFEEVQASLRETVTSLEEREKEVETLRQRMHDAGVPLEESEMEALARKEAKKQGIIFSDGDQFIPADPHSLHADPFHSPGSPSFNAPPRLLTQGMLPYDEFVNFINYLRQLRISVLSKPVDINGYPHPLTSSTSSLAHRGFGVQPNPASTTVTPTYVISPPSPAQLLAPHLLLSTHLSQPFLKRCVEEDSDPGLRLDVAPGLGFLSRRNVGTAIVDGTLLIEPLGKSPNAVLPSPSCALCGIGLEHWWTGAGLTAKQGVNLANMRKVLGGGGGWSISNLTGGGNSSNKRESSSSASSHEHAHSNLGEHFPPFPNQQVHLFRVNDTSTTKYPICPTYCLPRLRAVCEFWTYVRVMERGLLLEENFKFVAGRATGASASQDDLGAGTGLGVAMGGATPVLQPQEDAGILARVAGGPRRSSIQLNGEKLEGYEFEGGVMDGHVEMDGQDEHLESDGEDEAKPAKKPEMKVVTELAKEAAAESSGSATAGPGSPVLPNSPALSTTSNASASSSKPPVPKRSGARVAKGSPVVTTPASPIVPSSPVVDAPPAEPASAEPAPGATTGVPTPLSATKLMPPPLRRGNTSQRSVSAPADLGQIVGGANGWEDRCWAEVVRLKEAVFWARMAGIGPAADGSAVPSRHAKVMGTD